MMQDCPAADREQVIDTMIGLTRLSNLQRAIVAGSDGMELYLALRRRGFGRVSTPEICRPPKGQHAVALITAPQSATAIEATLVQVSRFLSNNAAIAVLIDSRAEEIALGIRRQLVQMGFRIEAGARCRQGFVLSAHRQGFAQMAKVA